MQNLNQDLTDISPSHQKMTKCFQSRVSSKSAQKRYSLSPNIGCYSAVRNLPKKNDSIQSKTVIQYPGEQSNIKLKEKDSLIVKKGEDLFTKTIQNVRSHANKMNSIRNSPERFKDTKHKVVCLLNTPSPAKIQSRNYSQSPLLQSERIKDRENQIKAKEAELEEIKQEIEAKRNLRCKEFYQTAQNKQPEAVIKTLASIESNPLSSQHSNNTSPSKKVVQSPTKKGIKSPVKNSELSFAKNDVRGEKFNTMIDQALKEITNDRSSRQALICKQKSQNVLQQKLIQEVKCENSKAVEPPKIKNSLYKPVLKTKTPLAKPQNPKKPSDSKPMSRNQSMSTIQQRPRSRNSIVPPQQTPEIVPPVVKKNYMLQTKSSQQRVRPTKEEKQPSRPRSALQKKPSMAVEKLPTFGAIDQQSEFKVIQSQIESQRQKSSKVDLYEQINKLTYGDYKKHDSPNSRLMKQKEETHKQKSFYQSNNIKGQQYVIGVDKGYAVTTKENLDYDLAQQKPMEFAAKFEQQELHTSKLRKNGLGYQLTENTGKRKVSQICEKARQVMLEARSVAV